MTNITIHDLDEDVRNELRVRAASNGRSMEEEARLILEEVLLPKGETRDLVTIFRSYFGPENGIDVELPSRSSLREPPSFD